MKTRFTYLLFLLTFSTLIGVGNMVVAQTVSGTATTTGCSSGGTITATQTGLGATPQYQLLLAGTVVAPVAGDATQFTNTSVFSSLISGSYTLKGRASAAGTVYTSSAITVANGYTAMNVVTPTATTLCATGTVALVTTVTGGKANYIYKIATQAAPSTALQTSAATSALTFTFNALPIGSYIVSVTDNCGATVTSATSITQSGTPLSNVFPQTFGIGKLTAGDCTQKIVVRVKDQFAYVNAAPQVLTAADRANFTWRLSFNGTTYGQDTNSDGNPDVGGADFPLTTITTTLPLGITDYTAAMAGNPKIIIYDKCGNSQSWTPYVANVGVNSAVCGSNGTITLSDSNGSGTYSMACYPINVVFTSAGNPTINYTMNSAISTVTGFIPGATYNITSADALGRTIWLNQSIVSFPTSTSNYSIANGQRVADLYNSAQCYMSSAVNTIGDVITVKVTSTDVPAMAGLTYTYNVTTNGVVNFNPTTPFPNNRWPAGNYVLQVTGACGTQNINYNPTGFKGVLSSLTTAPVCGGFNVTANTTLVESASLYEIIIVSGPSNVNATRDLVSTTTSQPFNGLAYGTYVFGIRPKGGSVFNTQTVTYSAANAITVDKANTGGFVCASGGTNGVLTITAASNSPAPGDVLQYALSTDGGSTYGTYQSGNTFSGLTNTTYFFKVKDACGNEITSSAQISVAAAPTATANGLPSTAPVCKTTGGTMALNVDAVGTGVTYTWSGPGISSTVGDPAYKGLKNPVISLDGLTAGAQSYSVSVLNPSCSATATVSSLSVNINALPTATIAYPAVICQSDAAKSVTMTGQTGGTYSALPAGLTIDATTGAVTPGTSTAGTYTVTYTFTNGTCPNTATAPVTINALPTATIAYPATPYYATGTVAVVQTGQGSGTYTALPAGLSINASTGLVDLGASTVGTYTVTYTFSNGTCSNTTTAPIKILSPSVTGTPATSGCKSGGSITAVPTGLGATPQYQLLKGGVVLAPVAGDATQYTNTALFTGLLSGTDYVIKAKSTPTATVYSSANITVANGYTDMAVATPTKVLTCVGATTTLTTTVTGGKSNYIYSIALQSSPGTAIETSASTSATSYTFGSSTPLPVGTYLVSVTDACGITVTGATSISNPTVGLADLKMGTNYVVYQGGAGSCSANINLIRESGFVYTSNGISISAADAALFTWKLKFQGNLYGADNTGDGKMDIGGAGLSPLASTTTMPAIANRANILADYANMKIVLSDACGNTKEFNIVDYNVTNSSLAPGICGGTATIKTFIGAGLSCLPIDFVFTNTSNPANVVSVRQNNNVDILSGGFIPGATYTYTYVDASGYTSGLYRGTNSISFPATQTFSAAQWYFGTDKNLNVLGYGVVRLTLAPSSPTDNLTWTVTASDNPLVPVGYTNSAILNTLQNGAQGQPTLPRVNTTDPLFYWPKGNYTIAVTSGCGSTNTNLVVRGYAASLTGNTLTPICGGFNYVLNGIFDDATAYQVKIAAGSASNVGATRDLASTTASLPFNGLTNGNYTFEVYIKGGTTVVLTQTVTLSSANVLSVDKSNTGGYVCTAGASNGTLTIAASTLAPAPNNTLTYALGTSTGAPYGAFQSPNTFTGLSAGTYFFQVKDGCGNVITSSAQIGVAAAPSISIDGGSNPATTCNTGSGTMQLDVDVLGASSYLWTGPGITALNKNLKNPVINKNTLVVGANNYTCQIVLGAPCNTTTTATAVINVNGLPAVVTVAPSAPCFPGTVDLTAAAVTAGSTSGLTYSYYTDAAGTNVLTSPSAIATSGIYYIKGSNGTCSDIKPVTVTINPLPVAGISYASGPYCKRGTATVAQTGQAGGTYTSDAGLAINAATGTVDLLNSTVGTHTVTYSFTNGTCASTTANTITINANKLPTALADINAVCSATPVAPTLSDPCAGGLTATTATAFPITTAGTTVVTWTFNYGNGYTQTVNQNVIITLPATPTISPASSTTFCLGGSVDLSATSATAYRWSRNGTVISGATSQIYTATTSGSYTVETGNGTCYSAASAPITVTVNPLPNAPTVATTQPVCGTPTGSISITAVTGETYSVDGGTYSSTLTYAGLAPGAHTVLAQSASGCISTATNILINPAKATASTPVFAVAQPVCGTPTGSISITAITGEKYSIDGGAFTATTTYASLTPGSHTVTSQSVDGCSSAATPFTISPAKAVANAPVFAVTQPVCGTPTGSISITAVAGEKYSVDGGAFTAATTYASLTPGAHTVTSQSVDGCSSAPVPFTITPAKAVASTPVFAIIQPVCGTPTGSISITAVTGEKYSIDGGTFTATTTYASLTLGAHTVTSQSVDGCNSAAMPFTITPAKVVANAPVFAVTQPVCGTPTGSISITAVTGEKYSIDGNAFTATLIYSALTPGAHTVTSQSVDGCSSAAMPFTITPAKAVASTPVFALTQPTCGTPTGSISITAVTGEKYSIDGGAFTATLIYSALTPGVHTVTSQSVDGCSSAATPFTISPAKAVASTPVFALRQPVCGTPTGSINITAVTGEKYSIDGGAFTATLIYSALTPGAHTVTSQSVDGCSSVATPFTISPAKAVANAPVFAVTQPFCGTPTGGISITAVTGEKYNVDGGAFTATTTYASLTPGAHTVTSQSVDGCSSAATPFTIASAKTVASTPVFALRQPFCGTPTGSISITAVTGEKYSVDGGAFTAALVYSGLTANTSHTITSQSIDGCTATKTVAINAAKVEANAPTVSVSAQPVCGTPTGSIAITAVTGETYSIDGGTYSAALTYSGLAPGTHIVRAKSADGCTSSGTDVVISPAKAPANAPVVAVTAQPTCALATGSISVTGVTGETYSVDGGTYSAALTYSGLAPGAHTVTAKSADGCTSGAAPVTVNAQPATPTASISYGAQQYQATGTASVVQSGQTGGSYTASPSGLGINAVTGTIDLAGSTPNQTYTVTYTFSNGTCTGTATAAVRVNSTPATIAYAKPAYCAGGTADIIRTGPANGTYTASGNGLRINAPTGTINLGASIPGSYTVTYTYQDGTITATATTSVTINAVPVVSVNSDMGTNISRGDIVTLTATGGTSYSWSGPDIQSGQNTGVIKVRPKQTATYTVTATNASGCSDVAQITITVMDDFRLEPNNVITPNGDGRNDTWVVKNLDYYPNNTVGIYDRAGRKVYGTSSYKNDWDGTYNGQPLAEGAYIYVIDLGKGIGLLRGTISIIRDNR